MTDHNPDDPPRLIAGPCPICGRPSETRFRPFCSRRCSDIDLARWFSGTYQVPVPEDEDEGPPRREREEE